VEDVVAPITASTSAASTLAGIRVGQMLNLPNVPAVRATSDWIRALDEVQTNNTEIGTQNRNQASSNQSHVQKKEPSKDFNVPLTGIDHKLMIAKLRLGGLTENEAEQTISFRKTAFNKVLREFKKDTGTTTKSNSKKPEKYQKMPIKIGTLNLCLG
jgi:hypothetical protein